MADLVRRVTIGRGLDPRDFALLAIGGAGPLHVGAYGRDVGARAVIVPDHASEFSALGIATADTLVVERASAHMVGPFASEAAAGVLQRLEDRASHQLRQAGADGNLLLRRSVDMRYKGQIHEVSVPIDRDPATLDPLAIVRDFHLQYERRYGKGTTNLAAPVEALSWEVRAAAPAVIPNLVELTEAASEPPAAARKGERQVFFVGGWRATPIFDRARLHANNAIDGPAVVEAPDTTILVNPGQRARMDRFGDLVIEVST
jgi:N-methylhydantoinase A